MLTVATNIFMHFYASLHHCALCAQGTVDTGHGETDDTNRRFRRFSRPFPEPVCPQGREVCPGGRPGPTSNPLKR